jgi:hypothetical protein
MNPSSPHNPPSMHPLKFFMKEGFEEAKGRE